MIKEGGCGPDPKAGAIAYADDSSRVVASGGRHYRGGPSCANLNGYCRHFLCLVL